MPAIRGRVARGKGITLQQQAGIQDAPYLNPEWDLLMMGFPPGSVEYRKPAAPFQTPHRWESPRTITADARTKDYREQIQGIGNAVFVPTAFAIFTAIREMMAD